MTEREYKIALHKILNLAQHGTPPDYGKWLSTLDEIAEIARRALEGNSGRKQIKQSETSILPYCMMPDGGDACKGYAALKAERERLQKQCEGLADSAMKNGQGLLLLERENEQLRAALDKIMHHPRHYYDDGDSDTAQAMREIARRALDGEE